MKAQNTHTLQLLADCWRQRAKALRSVSGLMKSIKRPGLESEYESMATCYEQCAEELEDPDLAFFETFDPNKEPEEPT